MHLSEHSLRQLDEAYLRTLDLEALRGLSLRLLADLKDARARLDARSAGRSRSPQRPASAGRTHPVRDLSREPDPALISHSRDKEKWLRGTCQ